MDTCDVAILGAGPYGLSVAAHLSESRSLDLRVIGEPMSFWERHMPAGMLLRSPRVASHICDPHRRFTLDAYEAAAGRFSVKMPPIVLEGWAALDMAKKVPREDFVKYGRWFAQQAHLGLDSRTVSRVDLASDRFQVSFDHGASLKAKKLIIAAGIAPFTRIPQTFADLPPALFSHSSQHNDLGKFRDKDVLVLGGGQSALESAVLLNEAGARVDVFVRRPMVRWLGTKHHWMHSKIFSWMFYGRADVGPAGVSLFVQHPDLYRRLPRKLQDKWAPRSIRPAASCWVMARASNVAIHTSRSVVFARPAGERVRVRSNDGCERVFDHILLGTGYQVDIARYPFLSANVLQRIERVAGFPVLDSAFETTLSGLHFVGATAAWSFGPLMRFVAGAEFASPAVASGILGTKERTNAAFEATFQEGTWASSHSNVGPSV